MEKPIGYGLLETALGATFALSAEATRGVLRGRVVHLRRAGFGPAGQGYGSRVSYTQEDADQWALALAFEDAGLAPLTIKGIIEGFWDPHIAKIVASARRKTKADTYLAISYSELRAAAGQPVMPNIMSATATVRQAGKLLGWLTDEKHIIVFNLSALLRRFDEELVAAAKSGGEGADTSR
jgi:hypothetical protein